MGLMNHEFNIACDIPRAEVSLRLDNLLSSAGVAFTSTSSSISSTHTPLALIGFDRRMYSRRNWLGLNPFAHITALDANWGSSDSSPVVVSIRINRTRAWYFASMAIVMGTFMVAPALPVASAILLVGVIAMFAWVEIALLGTRLVAAELRRALTREASSRAA